MVYAKRVLSKDEDRDVEPAAAVDEVARFPRIAA
jgi:hypothetical protein